MIKKDDEYNWEVYTKEYSEQILTDVAVHNDLFVDSVDEINNKKIHANWKLLYLLTTTLDINSVFECGCGSGQHVRNIKAINPSLDVCGADLLQSQIDFGQNELNIPDMNLLVLDFTKKDTYKEVGKKYDLVYSHAVMTHLSYKHCVDFLTNMILLSNKYVVFVERDDTNYYDVIDDVKKQTNVCFECENISQEVNGFLIRKVQ